MNDFVGLQVVLVKQSFGKLSSIFRSALTTAGDTSRKSCLSKSLQIALAEKPCGLGLLGSVRC